MFYCHGEAKRMMMTPHLPQADVGGKEEERHHEVSHRAQGCPRARVQLIDKPFDSDILLCDDNKND